MKSACLALGSEDELLQVTTVRECELACVHSTAFFCVAFTYHKGQCRLSSRNRTTAASNYSESCTGEKAALYSEALDLGTILL